MTATTPDGLNWLGKVQSDGDFPILGSTRVAGNFGNVAGVAIDQLFFAWAASRGSGFLQPQVQWVALDKSNNFNLVTQQQLFDNTAAIAYPALATNSNGEVGVSTETGGEGAFENHAIGFLADNLVFTTTTSETGLSRYGDYATIRPDVTNTARFEAFGYGFTSGIPDTHFIIFGRGPVPTYNKVSMTITTGNDDGNSGSEIIATIAGPNGSGATDQNGLNTWDNWHVSTFTKDLDTPQTSAAGFSSITIILLQSSCETFCDNWDLQGITVVFSDTTGVLPPITLLNESAPSHEGNNCIARLKASPNPNSASFPLDGSNGGGMFPGGGGSSVCTTSNS